LFYILAWLSWDPTTPLADLMFNEGRENWNVELELEILVPHHHFIAPKPSIEWENVEKFKNSTRSKYREYTELKTRLSAALKFTQSANHKWTIAA